MFGNLFESSNKFKNGQAITIYVVNITDFTAFIDIGALIKNTI